MIIKLETGSESELQKFKDILNIYYQGAILTDVGPFQCYYNCTEKNQQNCKNCVTNHINDLSQKIAKEKVLYF